MLRADRTLTTRETSNVVAFRRKGGASDALRRIALEHEPALRRFVGARLSAHADHADQEDVVQETFLRVARQEGVEEKLSRSLDSVRSYLFSIATNVIRDSYRKAVTRQKYDDLARHGAKALGVEISAEDVVSTQEQLRLVKAAIMRLKPDCRDAFVLHRFEGLSYREVADTMNVSVSMVEKHIMQALSDIRRRVDRGLMDQ